MAEHHIRRLVLFYCILHFLLFELYFFFFFAFQLLQEHDLVPCSPLRSSSVSCFPAPSQLSSSMCSLVFLCLDNLEGSISELFSLYCCQLSSLCGNVCPIQVHFLRVNRCLHGILLSHVPQFFIGYLVLPKCWSVTR